MNTDGKGCDLGLLLSRDVDIYTGSACGNHHIGIILAITSFGAGHALKGMKPDQRWPSGLLLQQLGSRTRYQQGSDIHRAESKFLHRFYILQHQLHFLLDKGQNTLSKDMTGVYTKTSPCTKDFGQTHSVQGCSNIETNPQGHSKEKWEGIGIIPK